MKCLVVAVVLFPFFAKPDRRPYGIVLDGINAPIPHAVLRFRDDAGRIVATLTADNQGQFRGWELNTLRHDKIDGFALTRYEYHTGGIDHFYFSPLGTQTAFVHDACGRPAAEIYVILTPTHPYYFINPEQLDCSSNQNGLAQANGVTLGARNEVDCWDTRYAVSHVQTIASSQAVRYDVTVIPAATITGTLIAPSGRPFPYCHVFADCENDEATADTNERGRFHLTGLRPGTYDIGAGNPTSDDPNTPTKSMTVAVGQTVDITLHGR